MIRPTLTQVCRTPRHGGLLIVVALTLAFTGLLSSATAQEIGFWEDFALAEDRAAALQQLIPGTEDYYYFHCLHYQNLQQFERVDKQLQIWQERFGKTSRWQQIKTRQMLLSYDNAEQVTLDYLRSELNLRFDHKRLAAGEKPDLPTDFDNQRIARQVLLKLALARKDLRGFESSALAWLAAEPLSPDKRRLLLQRLERPDIPNLVELVDADLKHVRSGGFGTLTIHRRMLRDQLDELAKRQPKLLNDSAFVRTYMTKLAPNDDEDWSFDRKVKQAHLDRLWAFVKDLGPIHNSLKAHVLYRQLALDRAQGVYNRKTFERYLALPRNARYVNPKYLQREDLRRYICNLGEQFPESGLPPVGNDEPLVRSYLLHFFVKDGDYKKYLPLVQTEYLKQAFAEAKIVNQVGNPEQWASLLPPATFQALKERVDLDFAETNRRLFPAQDEQAVGLDVLVKNVDTLLVKIFKINADAFYRSRGATVNTNIELDGLIPNWERTIKYDAPPLHRNRQHFDFPEMNEPGVYVVDFIGNGKSSRAVIQKGRLRVLPETAPNGQLLTVLTEAHEVVKNASVLLGGKIYEAEKDGRIYVPFATQPGRKPVVIFRNQQAYLDHIQHEGEQYRLVAGMYLDKESQLARREARLVVRPQLLLNGAPVSVEDLENVSLTITTTDLDGIQSVRFVPDFQLKDHRATLHAFDVPSRIAKLDIQLHGQLSPVSRAGEKIKLSAAKSIAVNTFDSTENVADLHLSWVGNQYALLLLGRSGEPLGDQPIRLQLKHRDFTQEVVENLKSSRLGMTDLGALSDIDRITATWGGVSRTWNLRGDDAVVPSVVHGTTGQTLQIPLPASMKINNENASLFATRHGQFVANKLDALKVDGGLLTITGLEAGDYELLLKRPRSRRIQIRITNGPMRVGFACGASRLLEVRNGKPLAIRSVAVNDGKLNVSLQNANRHARVHVFATRLYPSHSAIDEFSRVSDINPSYVSISRRPSLFAEGRKIGEEYRYILERQLATKFPGNMLERPSLLLNPWALRTTDNSNRDAKGGDAFGASPEPNADAPTRAPKSEAPREARSYAASLNFLATTGTVIANLTPDDKGNVSLDFATLGDALQVRVIAADPKGVVERALSLPVQPWAVQDLRMSKGLDPAKHFVQQQAVSILKKGDKLTLSTGATRIQTYDSLARVFQLMRSLNPDGRLEEFRFVLDWPDYDDKKKRQLYSKYACHELNFFLAKKDPAFFEQVVRPFIANKNDRTFMDEYLLDEQVLSHTTAWRHSQLNIVERILIGHRIRQQTSLVSRHVQELFDLDPPKPQKQLARFEAALSGVEDSTIDFQGMSLSDGILADAKLGVLRKDAGIEMRFANGRELAEVEAIDKLVEKKKRIVELQSKLQQQGQAMDEEFQQSGGRAYRSRFSRQSGRADRLYQHLDKTMEWAENNYYKLPIEVQRGNLVRVNHFWNDYAHNPLDKPFLSKHFADAATNLTESMLALAVLDLPFKSEKHDQKFEDDELTVKAASPLIVLHEELQAVEPLDGPSVLLVSQNFFKKGDRYRHENNQRLDKYVTDEFLTHVVYGCQMVITNPTSTPRQLNVLFQLPEGSMAVKSGKRLATQAIQLGPYATTTLERLFYFPRTGQFRHFPVHVSQDGDMLASAQPHRFNVVESLSRIDRSSWDYISQNGTNEDVMTYLENNNLQRTNLDKIAFRMAEPDFFDTVVDFLADRRAYNNTLWSYGVRHNSPKRVEEFLRHQKNFVARCGPYLDSPLLHVDPVERRTYQHLDYRPLVNARAHQLGSRRKILNNRLFGQYHNLLQILACRRELSDDEKMAVTYYLLLQDRVELALRFFEQVNREQLAAKIQHDYFTTYTSFYTEDLETARNVADRYTNYPVDRWRMAFANVRSQLDQIEGKPGAVIDPENRDQTQADLANNSPSLSLKVDGQKVKLDVQNVKQVELRFYLMDVELLFSRNPFVQQQGSGQFAYIQPNLTKVVKAPAGKQSIETPLPAALRNRNVLVEARADGVVRTQAHYSNSMSIQLVERFGNVRVTDTKGKPLAKAYVKAYARFSDGSVKFYKDGYTDLRGRFDYASLSTNDLDRTQRFAILVFSEDNGAKVLEATPPAR